ncbi:putzig [Lycorma delicatula]|uniref:putzig n=1 Tax=Lycorma delicatula TaxID=130591 RepID=UPI003F515CC8
MGTEGLNCFVCDGAAVGRYFTLATCRTQTSKVRLIEKLGQLVGDKYMVVISEEDIICRGCASMMNTLDRLEKEMNSLRTVVLRYLEKKYELEEDELLKNSLPSQKNFSKLGQKKGSGSNDLVARKRKAASMDGENDEWNSLDRDKKDGRSNTWLQCDKCKYTTLYNSFMIHHIRKHGEPSKKSLTEDKPQTESSTSATEKTTEITKSLQDSSQSKEESIPLQTMEIIDGNNKLNRDQNSHTITAMQKDDSMSDESETVEMIAAEINEFTDERVMISNSAVESTADSQSENVRDVGADGQEHVTLQVASGEDSIDGSNTICMVDENGMIVQKMEQAEDGTLYVQVMENPDSTKQVLSVGEDGSVQMVEVMWDEMVNPEAVEDDNIPF